jgi:hypothetical protein
MSCVIASVLALQRESYAAVTGLEFFISLSLNLSSVSEMRWDDAVRGRESTDVAVPGSHVGR